MLEKVSRIGKLFIDNWITCHCASPHEWTLMDNWCTFSPSVIIKRKSASEHTEREGASEWIWQSETCHNKNLNWSEIEREKCDYDEQKFNRFHVFNQFKSALKLWLTEQENQNRNFCCRHHHKVRVLLIYTHCARKNIPSRNSAHKKKVMTRVRHDVPLPMPMWIINECGGWERKRKIMQK